MEAKNYLNEKSVAIVPLGSVEQHGPQGPLGTDYIIPFELCKKIEAALGDAVVILPTMPFGVCPYHIDFPGTLNIGYEAMRGVMWNVTDSLYRHGIRRILFFNGHGGNGPALDSVSLDLFQRGAFAVTLEWWTVVAELNAAWKGGHGDWQETAALMSLRPETVKNPAPFTPGINQPSEAVKVNYITQLAFKGASLRAVRNVAAVIDNGGYVAQDKAPTIDEGRAMMDAVINYTIDFIREFATLDLDKIHYKGKLLG